MYDHKDLNRCIRCGRCMSVCPVYQTTFSEADVARGRLALLEFVERDAEGWSKRLEEVLSRCLLCGACSQICAAKVQASRRIQGGRQHLLEAGKGNRSNNLLIRSLREEALSGRILLKGGALLQALVCKKIPESSGLHLRFPVSFFAQRITVPSIAWNPFLKAYSHKRLKKKPGPRIGFFVGCGTNYLFPDVARALVRILEHMAAPVAVPTAQVCCGLPAYVSGDAKTARALAIKNIEAFRALDLDAVLTVCASCGSHMKHLPALFEDDPSWQAAAVALAEKQRDAMAFLVERFGLDAHLEDQGSGRTSRGIPSRRVAYHDPCHLRIGQGVTEAPRRLLRALPGVELVEASHPGQCCGHGGDFNLTHFDLSMRILDRRMDDFQRVKPDAIVTGCTACLLQLTEGISRNELVGKVQVCHPLVLVDQAIDIQTTSSGCDWVRSSIRDPDQERQVQGARHKPQGALP